MAPLELVVTEFISNMNLSSLSQTWRSDR